MNEIENNVPQDESVEITREIPTAETAVSAEPNAEAVADTPSESEKPVRKSKKALIVVLVAILVIAVGVSSFILGRHSDFDFGSIFAPFFGSTEDEAEEAPEFLGAWSDSKHSVYISAGGIIEIDGAGYSYTWDSKTITVKAADGESYAIRYKKMSNTLKLWLDGNKDDSVSLRRNTRGDADALCGSWSLGDTEIVFNADGTAEIYGKSYTYTADSYEITCKSKSGKEYMFYTVDGDFLSLWLPGESAKTLRFARSDSLIPMLTGTWVSTESDDYIICHADGTVEFNSSSEEYFDTETSTYIEDESLVISVDGIRIPFDIELDGDRLELCYLGETIGTFCRISTKTDLTDEEIELLWELYSPTEAV